MFEELLNKYPWSSVTERIYNAEEKDVKSAIQKERKTPDDFYALFSPAADKILEELALLSQKITRQRFGNIIQLYAPLYISNECRNSCAYCGFNSKNNIKRLTLSIEETEEEARILFNRGFRHILLLTGDDRHAVSPERLSKIVRNIHGKFASVAIEVYPLSLDEYKIMAASGVDGLAVYQETYDKIQYSAVHKSGMKQDFIWRLDTPERAGDAGFRKIGIGALMGLSDWRTDGFFTALHGYYLSKKYWKSHIQISFPRLREAHGNFTPPHPVSDRGLAHLICVMRILLPDSGLLLSTRESSKFRDNALSLGITMMSAGSKTEPGGYSVPDAEAQQFTIHDNRTPEEIAETITLKGFDPVWKDWDREFLK